MIGRIRPVPKAFHEFRDPIHGLMPLSSDERMVLNSLPLQRLRHIHQLALTYLVYPGATHRRFEHWLGVLPFADKVFSVLTRPDLVRDEMRRRFPVLLDLTSLAIGDEC
jgi:HD superfamily phosphohydrolase